MEFLFFRKQGVFPPVERKGKNILPVGWAFLLSEISLKALPLDRKFIKNTVSQMQHNEFSLLFLTGKKSSKRSPPCAAVCPAISGLTYRRQTIRPGPHCNGKTTVKNFGKGIALKSGARLFALHEFFCRHSGIVHFCHYKRTSSSSNAKASHKKAGLSGSPEREIFMRAENELSPQPSSQSVPIFLKRKTTSG